MNDEIRNALRGNPIDSVHCTIHSSILHSMTGEAERHLRNQGFTIAEKGVSAYIPVTEDMTIETQQHWLDYGIGTETLYKTPVGVLTEKKETGSDGSEWIREYAVKTVEDLSALKWILAHTKYYPNDQAIMNAENRLGNDGVVVCRLMRSPLQTLFVDWIGAQQTILLLYDYPDEMADLMKEMQKNFFRAIELTAKSPARIVWSAENVTSILTSPPLFEKYCLPFYNEVADLMHENGKLYGVHMDGNLAALKELIGETRLDFIEGFTPPPMCDLDVKEALDAWPGKVLWVNFPGSILMQSEQTIIDYTVELLNIGMKTGRFLLTISEDLPNWRENLKVLKKGIDAYEMRGT